MKNTLILLSSLFLLIACGPISNDDDLHVNKGKISVAVDESFKQIAEAEIVGYQAMYPDTEFEVTFVPEQKAIGLLLADSAELAIVSRELTPKEQTYFTSRQIEYQPAKMAIDAVTLITSKDNAVKSISMSEIKAALDGTSDKYQLVFDNGSSSNLNSLTQTLNVEKLSMQNIFSAKGTEDVISQVSKSSKLIGVIGYNWISDVDSKKANAFRETVDILPIEMKDGSKIIPSKNTLSNKTYPLSKTIYLHTTQHRWGVAKGFVRYACSQVGQIIVDKMDLQPYYRMAKVIQMNNTKDINTTE